MPRIAISTVTSQELKEKKYLEVFPEYYNLAAITENSLWHDNQNVFDHVVSVFAGLEKVVTFQNTTAQVRVFLQEYLLQHVGVFTRREILTAATLLHDIAKVDTLVQSTDGTSRCPGHELIAASQVSRYADRFGFDSKDANYIERIVRYHGLVSDFLTLQIANGNKEKYLTLFMQTVGDVAIELVLLMESDLLGSDLHKKDAQAYDDRIATLAWMLAELVARN